jgi:hypothetical protein
MFRAPHFVLKAIATAVVAVASLQVGGSPVRGVDVVSTVGSHIAELLAPPGGDTRLLLMTSAALIALRRRVSGRVA